MEETEVGPVADPTLLTKPKRGAIIISIPTEEEGRWRPGKDRGVMTNMSFAVDEKRVARSDELSSRFAPKRDLRVRSVRVYPNSNTGCAC